MSYRPDVGVSQIKPQIPFPWVLLDVWVVRYKSPNTEPFLDKV